MKNFISIPLCLCTCICLAQKTTFLTQPAIGQVACQSPAERAAENAEIKMLKQAYYARHRAKDSARAQRTQRVLFGWPMRASTEYDFQYNYFNLQNYVDQKQSTTADVDYHCFSRTYDDHDASDINLWPFWWRMMDNDYVMAVAAAPGVILGSPTDGNFDRNCTQTGSPNRVTILHDDGSTSRYLHLKKNSVTNKVDGDWVEQGEFLGYIGSSGRSSNPHLHFAVYDASDNLIEPFYDAAFSACHDVVNNETWWQNQRAYWEPQINRLMTHSSPPFANNFCPEEEIVNPKNQFSSGDNLFAGIAFMDGQIGDVANCILTQPNGITYASWNVNLNTTNSRIYSTTGYQLPSGNAGTWTFKVTYRSRVYAHFFTVGCKSSETVSGNISGNDGYIAGGTVSSTAVHTGSSNTKVLYQSATAIEFKPGFEAVGGIHLKARIKPCTYTE